jgi:dihydrofolate reductase
MSSTPGPVRVFIASSLDGFIAGPGDDLSWLPPDGGEEHGYDELMAATGAVLMGRTTYDVVVGFEGAWPFGKTPVFVATSRPLDPAVPTVRPVAGDPARLLAAVRGVTEGGVYLDGGVLIRQFLAAG